MKRAPITTQRSPWCHDGHVLIADGVECDVHRRRVHDGWLTAIGADEPGIGWHLSISHRGNDGRLRRYPTWDEIAHARDALLPADLGFVMHLPPAGEYVALHDTTFHLHQHPEPTP